MPPVRWRISFATPMALHHIVGPRAHCNPGCWIGTGSTSIHHILRIARRSTVRRGLRGGTQWQPATAVGSRARHGVARDLWLVNTLSFGAERKKSLLSSGEIGVGHRGPQVRKPCVVAGLPAHLWRRPPFPPTRVQQVLIKHLPGLLALGIHPDACCGVGLVGTALGTRGRHLLRARYGSQSQQEAKTPRAARG